MKDWVIPYVRRKLKRKLNEYGVDEFKIKMPLESKEELEYDLSEEFNCDFGSGLDIPMFNIFGSVLADLPEDAFRELCNRKDEFFFCHSPYPGAEVKIFQPEKIPSDNRFYVVTIPHEILYWPAEVARGMLAHELAHLYEKHATSNGLLSKNYDEREDEANQTAMRWGFGEEIEALGEYEKDINREGGVKQ